MFLLLAITFCLESSVIILLELVADRHIYLQISVWMLFHFYPHTCRGKHALFFQVPQTNSFQCVFANCLSSICYNLKITDFVADISVC